MKIAFRNHSATAFPESRTCQVYAIRLKKSVLNNPKFRAANPNYIAGYPCYYVGMTSLPPHKRFAQHVAGKVNASTLVHAHCGELEMSIVPVRKPTLRTWAMKLERNLAE